MAGSTPTAITAESSSSTFETPFLCKSTPEGARDLDLIDRSKWEFVWVTDFPLLEWNEDENRWDSPHHPFTSPYLDQIDLLENNPGKVLSRAYDLVVNGSG